MCYYLQLFPIMFYLHKNHIMLLISSIGKQIKKRRTTLGITQQDLSELAGISPNTLYKIERGQANPSLRVLIKIAEVLGMELKMEVKQTIM